LSASVQCVFEGFARTEFWNFGGFDFNLIASAWVAASAGSANANGESSKTDQSHGIASFQGLSDSADGGLKRARGGCFGDIGLLGNVFDQFSFVHKGSSVMSKKSSGLKL